MHLHLLLVIDGVHHQVQLSIVNAAVDVQLLHKLVNYPTIGMTSLDRICVLVIVLQLHLFQLKEVAMDVNIAIHTA